MAIALQISDDNTPGQNHHFLNPWVNVMMEDIWHFNQCAGVGAPMQTANDKGGSVYLQTEREYIARHVESAAARMAQDLNYWICPAYFTQEIDLGKGVPIQNQVFRMRWLKMLELGRKATALISSGAAVVYSDPNGFGIDDTATITVNTSIAVDEIRLFFQVTDGAPTAADPRYEIEPLTVVSNGAGVVTITAHRALFVKPTEWAKQYTAGPNVNSPNIIDTATAAGFVTAVDVYRIYTDTTTGNIELLSADNTVLQTFTGDIVRNELSAVRMGDLCSTVCWDQYPKKVRVYYRAGAALVNGNIDNELYEAAVAYSCGTMLAKLGKMSYWGLDNWTQWHAPMVEKIGNAMVPVATKRQSNSGYGARTGQAYAWEVTMDRRLENANKFF